MNRNVIIGAGVVLIVVSLMVISSKHSDKDAVAQNGNPSVEAKQLYAKAENFKKSKELVKAKDAYRKILADYPEAENISSVQKELEQINMELIFSNRAVPGKTTIHEVVSGDTLGKLAKKYGTTIELIKKSNNLKSDVIRVGQRLRIWTGMFNVYIDKSQNILILKDGNEVIKVYDVSTGTNNSTPVGEFTITSKLVDPVWFNRGVVVPPDSPANVLGSRWLGFDIPGYGIHGTVEPDAIGQQVTAGCVRMRNPEVEELYSILPMRTKVTIVD